ncbi:tetratricopeptide repeat protein [Kitasatospora sp. NPDC057936]|uniref:tetratricopeptide repeat protein n=1 Tax=Kitasatospora sp. NPDC057936 TaxID=3346283 RepID=UPI0036D85834
MHEQPSQLLMARHQIVPFTGRLDDLKRLTAWRDDPAGPVAAVRLLHGPGGQGKTRLGARFAADTPAGWQVWQAAYTAGSSTVPTARRTGPPGQRVLVIVDYAERWPATTLMELMHDLARRRCERLRVLLIARSAGSWWQNLPHDLQLLGYAAGAVELEPLRDGATGDRAEAFLAARDRFADALGVADAEAVEVPGNIDDPAFGLMLTVHMAALVGVDRLRRGLSPTPDPDPDPEALSVYLLNRERAYWHKLHTLAEGRVRIDADVMAQAVFTATLVGPLGDDEAETALQRVRIKSSVPVDEIIDDHALCYPASNPLTVLEPLYPDRLGEDFLAQTTRGHHASRPLNRWAVRAAERLLAQPEATDPPVWTRSALTVLIETAHRWKHVATGQLYPLLRSRPQLALEAGGAALARLAEIPDVDPAVLQAIEAQVPDRRVDLDAGIATLAQRLADHLLATTKDPADRARIHHDLSGRYFNAGFHGQGVVPAQEAVDIYRELVKAESPARSVYEPALGRALDLLGIHLELTGRHDDALRATEEAASIFRRLSQAERERYEPTLVRILANLAGRHQSDPERRRAVAAEAAERGRRWADAFHGGVELAGALENLGSALADLGRHHEALAPTREAADIRARQARDAPKKYEPDLARVLWALGSRLERDGQREEALAVTQEAVDAYRRLAEANPAGYESALAEALNKLGIHLTALGRLDEALAATQEAVDVHRRLAVADFTAHQLYLAKLLNHLSIDLAAVGRLDDAFGATREVVDVYRSLAATDPATHEPGLAVALDILGDRLWGAGRLDDSRAATQEAVDVYRRLAVADFTAHWLGLAAALNHLGARLSRVGRWK